MERLVRLVVHVEEALRVAQDPSDAHQRLALLLLDSAAELMLHRECEALLSWERSDWSHLQALRQQEARMGRLPPGLKAEQRRLESKVTSNTRRDKIERTIDAKAEFVRDASLLPDAHVRVLRKLHAYRNEAYHRDLLRPATLATSVQIYGYIVCTMMRDLPVHGVVHAWEAPIPRALARYIGDDVGELLEAQRRIANELLATLGLGQAHEVTTLLSEHLLDRLAGIEEGLEYAAEYLAEIHNDRAWDVDAVLHQIQINDVYTAAFGMPAQVKAESVPVKLETLASVRRQAEALRMETDAVAAFSQFADVEDAFEAVEIGVISAVQGIDEAIDLEIRRSRGG